MQESHFLEVKFRKWARADPHDEKTLSALSEFLEEHFMIICIQEHILISHQKLK
jgi:hypothetical protein